MLYQLISLDLEGNLLQQEISAIDDATAVLIAEAEPFAFFELWRRSRLLLRRSPHRPIAELFLV